jgi:hypothetical protein
MNVIITSYDGKIVKTIPIEYLEKFIKNGWTSDSSQINDDIIMMPMNPNKQRGRPRKL